MKDQELVNALSHLKVETGSLACIGCGYEHNCSIHGCAIVRKVADTLSALRVRSATLARYAAETYMQCDTLEKENTQLRAELAQVKRERDGIKVAFEDVASKPDCNTCCDRSCMYRPRAGETTRFNCPLWLGPQKEK